MAHPIAIFGYKRPEHLDTCLKSLELNELAIESDIYILIDGPKCSSEAILVNQCIDIAEKNWRFKNKKIITYNKNLGLRQSIRIGIDKIFEFHNSIIVVEDDLQVHPKFISFISDGLDKYKDEQRIGSIQGFSMIERELEECYFLPSADSWGWGTWKSRWKTVNWDSSYLLAEIEKRKLTKQFNYDNSYNFTNLLRLNSMGKIDSWAIDWQASIFLDNKLSLYPPFNMVSNIGMGDGATHTNQGLDLLPKASKRLQWTYPKNIQVDNSIYEQVCQAYAEYLPQQRFAFRLFVKPRKIFKNIRIYMYENLLKLLISLKLK